MHTHVCTYVCVCMRVWVVWGDVHVCSTRQQSYGTAIQALQLQGPLAVSRGRVGSNLVPFRD